MPVPWCPKKRLGVEKVYMLSWTLSIRGLEQGQIGVIKYWESARTKAHHGDGGQDKNIYQKTQDNRRGSRECREIYNSRRGLESAVVPVSDGLIWFNILSGIFYDDQY